MGIKRIIVKLIIFIVTVIISFFAAYPLGEWIQSRAVVVSYDIYFGPFPGYLDGLVISYIFFSALLFPLHTKKLRSGFYWSLPALLILLLLGAFDPQLWLSLVFLATGLALAWIILLIKKQLKG